MLGRQSKGDEASQKYTVHFTAGLPPTQLLCIQFTLKNSVSSESYVTLASGAVCVSLEGQRAPCAPDRARCLLRAPVVCPTLFIFHSNDFIL